MKQQDGSIAGLAEPQEFLRDILGPAEQLAICQNGL
jgi:hypothetical protein